MDNPIIKIFKKKKNVAACSDGQSCDTKAKVNSGGGFNFTKKRYNVGNPNPPEKPVPGKQPTNATYQNVRDLGAKPGEPSNVKTDYASMSEADKAARRKQEIKLTKARKYFGK